MEEYNENNYRGDSMRERLNRLMQGRYGTDHLNRFIIALSMTVLFVSIFTGWRLFYSIGLMLMVLSYFRLFSRNISNRYQENQKYLTIKNRFLSIFKRKGEHLKQRKSYRFFKCPSCKQKVRVPRGKGKIEISCPKCKAKFIKRS